MTRRLVDDHAVQVTYSAHPPTGGPWPHNTHADYDGDQRRLTVRADLPAPHLMLALEAALNLCILGPAKPPPPRPTVRHLRLIPHPRPGGG